MRYTKDSSIRIDSTAIFVIGPCYGLRKVFGSDAIIESAVAEDPLPSTWRNVEKILHDEKGNVTSREALHRRSKRTQSR